MTLNEIQETCKQTAQLLETTWERYKWAWTQAREDKDDDAKQRNRDAARAAVTRAAKLTMFWYNQYYEIMRKQDPDRYFSYFYPNKAIFFSID